MPRRQYDNAVKHGKARHIDIGLQVRSERVTLLVKNDGIDFPEKSDRGSGMGLRIMRHRAGMIGASLDIKKSPRGGTVVSCAFDKMSVDKAGKVKNGRTE